MKFYWVYIICSRPQGALYTGITNNLARRIYEHKQKLIPGFSKKHNVNKLVYIEQFRDIYEAIHREKCLKNWNRLWKIKLIEDTNPDWQDLCYTILS
ncbi:GIY-YIG nuclease family protein [Rickettsia endosymbiont of Halotydeus destructor]|uniref:GIY-YIG nuclease family protein n=1 Tax=Rickettsia endosymbiont of Halotydeus destructor TaxID=2996754 RepID=UPI003BB06111